MSISNVTMSWNNWAQSAGNPKALFDIRNIMTLEDRKTVASAMIAINKTAISAKDTVKGACSRLGKIFSLNKEAVHSWNNWAKSPGNPKALFDIRNIMTLEDRQKFASVMARMGSVTRNIRG